MITILRRLARHFLYPQECCLCGCWVRHDDPRPVCADCLTSLDPLGEPVCPVCGIPVPADILGIGHVCSACRERSPSFDRARAWGLYGGALREVIHQFKFEGLRHLSLPLGELLAQTFQEQFSEDTPELLVPVPLHPHRYRERGYDQTMLLARRLSALVGLPVDRSIRRARHTAPQFGLDLSSRRRNLRGAFSLQRGHPLEDRRIVIVDDVMTSGTTVEELGRELRRSGRVAWIGVLTVARVFHYSEGW